MYSSLIYNEARAEIKRAFSTARKRDSSSGITNFIAHVARRGFAHPNRYEVIVTLPPIAAAVPQGVRDYFREQGITVSQARRLTLTVSNTNLPGKNLSTTDNIVHGQHLKMPYVQMTDTLPMMFRVGADMFEKRLFDAWQAMVIDPVTNTINFLDEYATTIEIYQLDKHDQRVYGVKLLKAFPVTVGELTLDSNETDTIQRLNVTFAYHKWLPANVRDGSMDTKIADSGEITWNDPRPPSATI